MINAREELLFNIGDVSNIEAAMIDYVAGYNEPLISINLRKGYTQVDLDNFLNLLNFEYDDSYGCQYVFGTIWLKDNPGWLERNEYDGSEWWERYCKPEIPDHLK